MAKQVLLRCTNVDTAMNKQQATSNAAQLMNSSEISTSVKPLAGLLVLSVEQALAAPLCTNRLAAMGARVIKIERAEGDFARGYDAAVHGNSSYFLWTNQGKESLVLDFKKKDDAELLESLLSKADVLVQNLAPGAMVRSGFGSESLRERYPKLITCDITGYGETGPASQLKAYDMLVQCESGLAGITGSPEACGRIGVSICDIGAGLNATIGILSALALRHSSDQGSGISVSLFDVAADWMTVPYLHEVYGAGAPKRQGLQHPSIAPYGAYTCLDEKSVVISIQNEREWQQFCNIFLKNIELFSDLRFNSNTQRVKHRSELDILIADTFKSMNSDDAMQLLTKANTAYGRVNTVGDFAQHAALRTWPMNLQGQQDVQLVAPPVRTPWDNHRYPEAPSIGQHTTQLRAEFNTAR